MPTSVEDADHCQVCEEREAEERASVTIGGQPVGFVFVCEECGRGE